VTDSLITLGEQTDKTVIVKLRMSRILLLIPSRHFIIVIIVITAYILLFYF